MSLVLVPVTSGRARQDETLWGERTVPEEARVRWERAL